MLGAGNLTPTQIASIERSKAFHAKIAEAASKLNDLKTITMLEAVPSTVSMSPVPQSKRQWFHIVDEHAHQPFITEIVLAVANYYGYSRLDLCSMRRNAKVARARQVAYYLSKKLTGKSLPEIGRRIGNRDHTSVLSGIRKIERLRPIDPELDADIRAIAATLGGFLG